MTKKRNSVLNILLIILAILGTCVACFFGYINICYDKVIVSGSSMETTLSNGDYGLMKSTNSAKNNIKRFDIVIFKLDDEYEIIKRVIGLPNETIEIQMDGKILINGEVIEQDFISSESISKTYKENGVACGNEYKISDSGYYVLGDNRGNSTDSRVRGALDQKLVDGVLRVVYKNCIDGVCSSITPKWF